MSKAQGAKIVTPKQLKTLKYPLPKSWVEAAGLLKKKWGATLSKTNPKRMGTPLAKSYRKAMKPTPQLTAEQLGCFHTKGVGSADFFNLFWSRREYSRTAVQNVVISFSSKFFMA